MKTLLKILFVTLTLVSCATKVTNEQGRLELNQLVNVSNDTRVERALDFIFNSLDAPDIDLGQYVEKKLSVPLQKLKITHPDVLLLRQKYINFFNELKTSVINLQKVKTESLHLDEETQEKLFEEKYEKLMAKLESDSETLYKYRTEVEKKLNAPELK